MNNLIRRLETVSREYGRLDLCTWVLSRGVDFDERVGSALDGWVNHS